MNSSLVHTGKKHSFRAMCLIASHSWSPAIVQAVASFFSMWMWKIWGVFKWYVYVIIFLVLCTCIVHDIADHSARLHSSQVSLVSMTRWSRWQYILTQRGYRELLLALLTAEVKEYMLFLYCCGWKLPSFRSSNGIPRNPSICACYILLSLCKQLATCTAAWVLVFEVQLFPVNFGEFWWCVKWYSHIQKVVWENLVTRPLQIPPKFYIWRH